MTECEKAYSEWVDNTNLPIYEYGQKLAFQAAWEIQEKKLQKCREALKFCATKEYRNNFKYGKLVSNEYCEDVAQKAIKEIWGE